MKPDYDKYCLNGDFDYSAEEFKKIYPTFRDYAYSMLLITPIVIDIDGNIQLRGPVFKKNPQKSAQSGIKIIMIDLKKIILTAMQLRYIVTIKKHFFKHQIIP